MGRPGVFEFRLTFALPDADGDPAEIVDALFRAGCDDALVGTGRTGFVGLDFSRESQTAEGAIRGAVADVLRAIPGARLVEASPDLVDLAEVARLVGCTRQNVRKYAAGEAAVRERFPIPVHASPRASLYRFVEVARWLDAHTGIRVPDRTVAVAAAAAAVNSESLARRTGG